MLKSRKLLQIAHGLKKTYPSANYAYTSPMYTTKRSFSTDGEKQAEKQNETVDTEPRINFWWSVFGLWKNIALRYSIITVCVVAVVWFAWKIMSFFGSLTFDEVGKWSFYAGFLTCLSFVVVANLYKRQYSYKSNQVFTAAYARTTANVQIRELLGTPILPGKFKAFGYELRDGDLGSFDQSYHQWIFNYIKKTLGFGKQKTMQMLFQLNGSKRMAIVSCEVMKLPGLTTVHNLVFESLSVDVFHKDQVAKPGTKVRIILEGTEDNVVRDRAQKIY
jgi:hypothetical protein